MFKGTLIMRFDDTNPAKESSEFEQVKVHLKFKGFVIWFGFLTDPVE
jgi:glutamyl/glutaminyl-tRNA synthetase